MSGNNESRKRLLELIDQKQLAIDNVSVAIVCEKARHEYCDIKNDTSWPSAEDFKPRKRCYDFYKRTGICCQVMHGETASAGHHYSVKV